MLFKVLTCQNRIFWWQNKALCLFRSRFIGVFWTGNWKQVTHIVAQMIARGQLHRELTLSCDGFKYFFISDSHLKVWKMWCRLISAIIQILWDSRRKLIQNIWESFFPTSPKDFLIVYWAYLLSSFLWLLFIHNKLTWHYALVSNLVLQSDQQRVSLSTER